MMDQKKNLIHASCVSVNGHGALIMGPSGSGKSDLALRLIAAGGRLVSDDYVHIGNFNGELMAMTPSAIAGLIEVRGVGLVRFPYLSTIKVDLVLALTDRPPGNAPEERLPEAQYQQLQGVDVPLLPFYPFEASAVDKVKAAVLYYAGRAGKKRRP